MLSFYIKRACIYLVIACESIALSLCKQHGNIFKRFRRYFSLQIVRSAGITLNVKGHIEADTDIIISNHQSMTDIFVIEAAIGNDVRFVGRTGIMDKWPIAQIVNRVGHITVNQADKRAIIKLLKDVKACKGKKVVIFPEGTRCQAAKVADFEVGTKVLVEKLSLKAQPLVIKNILALYNESAKTAQSGVVEIEILPPVEVGEGWYEKIQVDMNEVLQQKVY